MLGYFPFGYSCAREGTLVRGHFTSFSLGKFFSVSPDGLGVWQFSYGFRWQPAVLACALVVGLPHPFAFLLLPSREAESWFVAPAVCLAVYWAPLGMSEREEVPASPLPSPLLLSESLALWSLARDSQLD